MLGRFDTTKISSSWKLVKPVCSSEQVEPAHTASVSTAASWSSKVWIRTETIPSNTIKPPCHRGKGALLCCLRRGATSPAPPTWATGGYCGKSLPQKRQTTASFRIRSPQNGHFLVLRSSITESQTPPNNPPVLRLPSARLPAGAQPMPRTKNTTPTTPASMSKGVNKAARKQITASVIKVLRMYAPPLLFYKPLDSIETCPRPAIIVQIGSGDYFPVVPSTQRR